MNSIYASEYLSQVIWPDFTAHFKSERSLATYQCDIDEYMNYIHKDFLLHNNVDAKMFYMHLLQKEAIGKIEATTVAKKIRELHSLAEFICRNRERYEVPSSFTDEFFPYLKELAKVEKHARSVPVEHIDKILKAAQNDLMAYCILVLLFRVGLFSTEICELKRKHFAEYDNGIFLFVPGRKEACYIPEDVYLILVQYFTVRKEHEYLFYNSRNNKLNPMYISRLNRKYMKLAGVPEYSAEALRNSCAFTMFAYNANSEQVARQMGITPIMIKRYQSQFYKDSVILNANQLVKLRVESPD